MPESILFKPERLTDEEYELVQRHPVIGAELIENIHSLHHLVPTVLHQHERYDGRGYPAGLPGSAIPLEARIVGLADAVEAMASDRPYSPAKSTQEILREVNRQAGTQFDPDVVAAFNRIITAEGTGIIINSARNVNQQNQKTELLTPA